MWQTDIKNLESFGLNISAAFKIFFYNSSHSFSVNVPCAFVCLSVSKSLTWELFCEVLNVDGTT